MTLGNSEKFDYVVVGGGSAGCVVAARLSERADLRVLLLEAGPADGDARMRAPGAWLDLWDTEVDYAYRTEPQAGLDGTVLQVPRGRVLGGSSAINGMVYLRGHQADYVRWAEAGGAGWSYEGLLPYFKRSETVPDGDPAWRGQDGPMRPSPARNGHPMSAAFVAAVAAGGWPVTADFNGVQPEGAGWQDLAIVDGRRQTGADAYLTPDVIARPNLTIRTGVTVTKLLLDQQRCCGVEYRAEGRSARALVEAEVVLCAGAVDSPRLLMLSGIGPGDELRAVGAPVHHDLPGVGKNLHDHPLMSLVYEVNREVPPGVNNMSEVSMSWRSDPTLDGPDMQMQFLHVPLCPPTMTAPANSCSFVVATVPDSRGTLRLRDTDPTSSPLINLNMLDDDRDVAKLVDGIAVVRELAEQDPLRDEWGLKEAHPGPGLTSRAELTAYARHATFSYFHLVGTCAMGTGPDAVVDAELRVRGVEGLRVADASIMPSLTSVNTNVATVAIGERAADLIAVG